MSRLRRCRRWNRFSLFCAALISLSACDGDDPSSPDNTVLDRSALIQALRSHGANVEIASPISQPFFSVGGQILRVNGGDVQTFEYASEADAQSDAARVSPDGFTIGTSIVSWVGTPHFFVAGRVIALYVGDDQPVLGPLQAVMGAQFAGG